MISCNEKPNIIGQMTSLRYGDNGLNTSLEIYVIDSCEYIGNLQGNRADILTHKGNCKNPIHRK